MEMVSLRVTLPSSLLIFLLLHQDMKHLLLTIIGPGPITVRMKAGNSIIIHGSGRLPGIDGNIDPILDRLNRTYIYADQIGFQLNGKPIPGQPLEFKVNSPH